MANRERFAVKEHPGLVWVIVDGAIRHVSEFARLATGARPDARCPQCDSPLVLKLGRVLRHHAAHASGVQCATTQPETLLHINTKLAIARRLRDSAGIGSMLRISERCAGGRDSCDKTRETAWLLDWDDVLVEYRVGDSRRPDIVLRRGGRDIGAIEVRATHAVPAEKETALSELGVAWVEVRAGGEPDIADAWSVSVALPVIRTSDAPAWRCAEHEAEYLVTAQALAEKRAELDEASRHSERIRAARVVDVYRPGGSRTRFIYRVDELRTDGRVHTVVLRRGRLVIASAPVSSNDEGPSQVWSKLREAFADDVARQAGDLPAFVDSPMQWARGAAAENIVEEAMSDLVGRDPTPLATRFPRRWFFASEHDQWFLPRTMRAVRWDRDVGDVFAAHPAWAQTRLSVRERAAPPGSWASPVFAARPLAASFVERSASLIHATRQHGEIGIVEVRASPNEPRALLIVERPPTAESIVSATSDVDDGSANQIWIAHPSDWPSLPLDATWAPGGRDARGNTVVSIDGSGVFRADQFVRAVATNDRRVRSVEINRRMAKRTARLRESARVMDPSSVKPFQRGDRTSPPLKSQSTHDE